MITWISVAEALALVTALSIDAFVSGFAYGSDKIRVPFSSVAVISIICSVILAVSLFFGEIIGPVLSEGLTAGICFVLLLGLGVIRVFDSAVKAFIRKHSAYKKNIKFSAFHLSFILNIYANPEEADRDDSKDLSPKEAVYLAIALSLDGLAVGFGAGITDSNPYLIIGLSLIMNVAAVVFGRFLGEKLTNRLRLDLSWLSGALLIALAVLKLL